MAIKSELRVGDSMEAGIAWSVQRTFGSSLWQRLMVCVKERKQMKLRGHLDPFVHILESIYIRTGH